MNIFKRPWLRLFTLAILFLIMIFLYHAITGDSEFPENSKSDNCEECSKKKAKAYLGENYSEMNNSEGDKTNYFVKIFSLLNSSSNSNDFIPEKDPEKNKAINTINSLSKNVCNDENLPDDVWISPKLIEKDPGAHIKNLEKLIQYCKGLKNGKTTSEEKKEYYSIKIRLLEERKELIKYYIETLDGQIEDMNEKKIAEMEDRKAEETLTPEEEKNNSEIEAETNRFYEDSVISTKKLIDQIDSAIRNYKKELSKL